MTLKAQNQQHQFQINAGVYGRQKGHKFEQVLSDRINELEKAKFIPSVYNEKNHIFAGPPEIMLLQYISDHLQLVIDAAHSYWLGGLATSGNGDILYDSVGNIIKGSKSDILLEITSEGKKSIIGVSVKNCNTLHPTNDQMFFSTAHAFCDLLRKNDISVSENAECAMSMFCGNIGYRPLDVENSTFLNNRKGDPNRYYWEELPTSALAEWKNIFEEYQDKITLLLFQKAYKNDPYPPEYLFHKTGKCEDLNFCRSAIFTMNEIVELSHMFSPYSVRKYYIKKGPYKGDPAPHMAPFFGFIQFQRGGQKQHPTQLQFNLKAGYFNHLPV